MTTPPPPPPPHACEWSVNDAGQPVCLVWLDLNPRVAVAPCPPDRGFEAPADRRPCGCGSDPHVFGHLCRLPAERMVW